MKEGRRTLVRGLGVYISLCVNGYGCVCVVIWVCVWICG
jgi:hypothetical protein